MPTVLRIGPFRFFLYAGDGMEPPHVHVEHDDKKAKFWLNPVRLQDSRNFSRSELNTLHDLIAVHRERLLNSGNEYFGV